MQILMILLHNLLFKVTQNVKLTESYDIHSLLVIYKTEKKESLCHKDS
jgi:hypothetical protein